MSQTTRPAMPHGDTLWAERLAAALPAANMPTLLMTLLHLTGDMRWLSPRYQCSRIRGIDDNDSGGLPAEVHAEICAAAHEALLAWRAGVAPALPGPSPELLVRMMKLSIGEDIPASYGEMIAGGMAIDPEFALDQRAAFDVPKGFKVVVIGAGVAGLCAAIRLQGAGVPYVVIEKNAEVGGTWHENTYPGAGVDTPNHIYSFSFAKHDWSHYFALRGEIQGYLEDVAERFALRQNIRFDTCVESARYDEKSMRWTVRTRDAAGRVDEIDATIVIGAVGLLNVPKMPAIPGLDSFKGPCFHTARWPQDLQIDGQRVAVIGNGASAMQVVPAIAKRVESLTVFQRSKQWAAPFEKFHQRVPEDKAFLLRELPFYQEWYRQRLAYIFNDRIHSTLQVDPEWPHPERSINKVNDRHRAHFTDYIKAEIGERQDLLDDLLPDYPPFGKRMLMDNGWFRTMALPNVTLVTGGIERVTENAVVGADGRTHEVDVIVVATGFDAINMLSSFALFGRGGKSIREAWGSDNAEAFLGVAVPDFPNFFVLAGPNTALGHGGSIMALMETQMRYVMGLLQQAMRGHRGRFELEVRRDRHDAYNERVQAAHGRMIWTHKGMSNWYRNARGRVVATTPFRNDDYWHMLRKTDLGDYTLRYAAETAGSQATQPEEVRS